jgi:ABC-type multidrug transport system fused ATPase/permease subunit
MHYEGPFYLIHQQILLILVIMIAHRLSSVRNANLVLYIEDGDIRERGTFDEVRLRVPEFDRHADISGLGQSQNTLEN